MTVEQLGDSSLHNYDSSHDIGGLVETQSNNEGANIDDRISFEDGIIDTGMNAKLNDEADGKRDHAVSDKNPEFHEWGSDEKDVDTTESSKISPQRSGKVMTFQANKFVVQATVHDLFPFLDRNQYMPGSCGSPNRHTIEIVSASPNVSQFSTPQVSHRVRDYDTVSVASGDSWVSCESSLSKASHSSNEKVLDIQQQSPQLPKLVKRTMSAPPVPYSEVSVTSPKIHIRPSSGDFSDRFNVDKTDDFQPLVLDDDMEYKNDVAYGANITNGAHVTTLTSNVDISNSLDCTQHDMFSRHDNIMDYASDLPSYLPSIMEVRSPDVMSPGDLSYQGSDEPYQRTTLPRYKPSRLADTVNIPEHHNTTHHNTTYHTAQFSPSLNNLRRSRLANSVSTSNKTWISPPKLLLEQPDYHSRRLRATNQTLSYTSTPLHSLTRDEKSNKDDKPIFYLADSNTELNILDETITENGHLDDLTNIYNENRNSELNICDDNVIGNVGATSLIFHDCDDVSVTDIDSNHHSNDISYVTHDNGVMRQNSDEKPDSIRHFVMPRKCSFSSSSEVLSPCDESPDPPSSQFDDLTPASSLDTLFDNETTYVAKPVRWHRNMSFKKAQSGGNFKVVNMSNSIPETASKVKYSGSGEALAENPAASKSSIIKRMIRRHKSLNDKHTECKSLSASTENLQNRDPLFKLPSLKSLLRRGSREILKTPFLNNFRRGSRESLTSLSEDSDVAPIARFCNDSDIEKAPGSPRTPLFTERRKLRRSLTTNDVLGVRKNSTDDTSMLTDTIIASIDTSLNSEKTNSDSVSIASTEISDSSLDISRSIPPPLPSSLKPSPRKTPHGTLGRRHTLVDSILDRRKPDSSLVNSDGTKREITTSYSNDSGIQRDSSLYSSNESFRAIPGNIARRPNKLHTERPKSDVSPRWSRLFDEIWLKENPDYLKQKPDKVNNLPDNCDLDNRTNGISTEDGDQHTSDLGGFNSFELSLLLRQPNQGRRKLHSSVSMGTISGASDMLDLNDDCSLSRQMSTPHPERIDDPHRTPFHLKRKVRLQRSTSLPENLEKLRKRRRITSYFGFDAAGNYCSPVDYSDESCFDAAGNYCSPVDYSDESCNESEASNDVRDKCHSTRTSHNNLDISNASQMSYEETINYAEALWDHITMDSEELGFRAGDLIEVTDQSDKDWWWGAVDDREGWFPAAFVRLRVNQDVDSTHQSPDDLWVRTSVHACSRRQARCNVVNEIMQAEREYVKHLKDVVEGYIVTVRRQRDMFSEDRTMTIFGNIEEIYDFSSNFLFQLERAYEVGDPSLSEIGSCFMNNARKFEIYSDYCNNHPRSGEELQVLYRNKKYRHFFEACRLLQDMIEIPLEGFLLTPIQKICKYPLQLSELLKYTETDHSDYGDVCRALEAMKRIATLINERKRKMENIEKISSWQSTVENWEDLLKRNIYVYKGRIILDHCQIIPLTDGRDPQFNATIRNAWKMYDKSRDKCFLICAKTPTDKQRWLKAFRDERQLVQNDQENDIIIANKWKRPYRASQKGRLHLEKPKKSGNLALGSSQTAMYRANLPSPVSKFYEPIKSNQTTSKKPWSLFNTKKSSKT